MLESRGAPTTTEEDRSNDDRRAQQFHAHGTHWIRRHGWRRCVVATIGDSGENGIKGWLSGEWNSGMSSRMFDLPASCYGAHFRLLCPVRLFTSLALGAWPCGWWHRHRRRKSLHTSSITSCCGWLVHVRCKSAFLNGHLQGMIERRIFHLPSCELQL